MEKEFRAGYAALLGLPNVGKSTLLNALLRQKLAIMSRKPQTTRHRLLAILSRDDCQIVFFDTPGIHKPKDALHQFMTHEINRALEDVDVAVVMIEPTLIHHKSSENIDEFKKVLKYIKVPIILAVNKIDTVNESQMKNINKFCVDFAPNAESVQFISALNKTGIEGLLAGIKSVLPISPPYFPPEQVTNQTERFIASELIREQVFHFTHHEIPYSSAVSIEEMKDPRELAGDPLGSMPKGKKVLIRATIHVESDSQKGIVIGKGGAMLKRIGSESRKEIEDLLDAPVFLELWVKVKKNWRKKPEFLSQVGYRE